MIQTFHVWLPSLHAYRRAGLTIPAYRLHDRIVMEGANVRSYYIKDGHLFLSGMTAGGYYELERLTTQRRR